MKSLNALRLKMLALLPILALLASPAFAQLGKIHGKIIENGKPVVGASVSLHVDARFTGKGLVTEADGKYDFSLLDPGNYTVQVTYQGKSYEQTVQLSVGETQPLAFQIGKDDMDNSMEGGSTGTVYIIGGQKEIFDVDPIEKKVLTYQEIKDTGIRDITGIATIGGGKVFQKDQGSPLNFSGSRSNATATFMDNMKLRGEDDLPLAAIEQVAVLSSGIPAEYGDFIGGAIVVTTRNPGMRGWVGNGMSPQEWKIEKARRKQMKKNKSSGFEGETDLPVAMNL